MEAKTRVHLWVVERNRLVGQLVEFPCHATRIQWLQEVLIPSTIVLGHLERFLLYSWRNRLERTTLFVEMHCVGPMIGEHRWFWFAVSV